MKLHTESKEKLTIAPHGEKGDTDARGLLQTSVSMQGVLLAGVRTQHEGEHMLSISTE